MLEKHTVGCCFHVLEASRSHLSFNSFGSDYNIGFGMSFGLEEVDKLDKACAGNCG